MSNAPVTFAPDLAKLANQVQAQQGQMRLIQIQLAGQILGNLIGVQWLMASSKARQELDKATDLYGAETDGKPAEQKIELQIPLDMFCGLSLNTAAELMKRAGLG